VKDRGSGVIGTNEHPGTRSRSLEDLSEEENTQLWAEAQLRDTQMDADPHSELSAEDVFHEVWSSFK